jgi:hypothetical protein
MKKRFLGYLSSRRADPGPCVAAALGPHPCARSGGIDLTWPALVLYRQQMVGTVCLSVCLSVCPEREVADLSLDRHGTHTHTQAHSTHPTSCTTPLLSALSASPQHALVHLLSACLSRALDRSPRVSGCLAAWLSGRMAAWLHGLHVFPTAPAF